MRKRCLNGGAVADKVCELQFEAHGRMDLERIKDETELREEAQRKLAYSSARLPDSRSRDEVRFMRTTLRVVHTACQSRCCNAV